MSIYAQIAIGLVALLHFGFFYLEMFLWDKPLGLAVFGTDPEFAAQSKALAANQGLYNAFLAVGLIWSIFPLGLPEGGHALATFFLWCVIIAGFYGGASVSQRIITVQALPALLALICVWAT